jgi:hypothetical protein
MFKNKAEREAFLKNYRKWEKHETEAHFIVELDFYMHKFKNDAIVIVTENTPSDIRYNLIIPDGDNYNPFDQHSGRTPKEFLSYNLTGCNIGTIIDYMGKRKGEI